jgi:endogenous inhibitor of DNA gyrase (YacG/DUF329 family)
MTKLQKEQIASRRKNGESYAKIAAALGMSGNTVKSYCRRRKTSYPPIMPAAGDTCANCGKPLCHTPGKKQKRFCSDKCRMAWWTKHPEVLDRKAVYSFVCANCAKPFTAYGNANRKYCSRRCAAAHRKASDE